MSQKQDYTPKSIRGLVISSSIFLCGGIILAIQIASINFFKGSALGLVIGLVGLYMLFATFKKHADIPVESMKTPIGVGATILLAVLIVFGIPGRNLLSENIQDFISGFFAIWIPLMGFGASFLVYRYAQH